jgi:hypothetical protein
VLKPKDETVEERRPYSKPQVQRVELVPEEAVLGACKGYNIYGPGTPGVEHCGLPFDACVLESQS